MELESVLKTAHIHFSNGILFAYVSNIRDYKVLFEPEGEIKDEGVVLESKDWRNRLNFPDFVIDISPKWSDNCLRIWVTDGYDLEILSDWLKTFEK